MPPLTLADAAAFEPRGSRCRGRRHRGRGADGGSRRGHLAEARRVFGTSILVVGPAVAVHVRIAHVAALVPVDVPVVLAGDVSTIIVTVGEAVAVVVGVAVVAPAVRVPLPAPRLRLLRAVAIVVAPLVVPPRDVRVALQRVVDAGAIVLRVRDAIAVTVVLVGDRRRTFARPVHLLHLPHQRPP